MASATVASGDESQRQFGKLLVNLVELALTVAPFVKGGKTGKGSSSDPLGVADDIKIDLGTDPDFGLKPRFDVPETPASTRTSKQLPAFSESAIDDAARQLASGEILSASGRVAAESLGSTALAKKLGHAKSGGYSSAFEGTPTTTAGAQRVLRDILSHPSRTVFGQRSYDVYDATGRGARFSRSGQFIGFLEHQRATR